MSDLLKNKDSLSKNINYSKLFFFLTLSSPDLVDENLDDYKLNEKLKIEQKFMDDLENRNDEQILFNNDNKKYLEDEYGEKATELILIGAKETCISGHGRKQGNKSICP